MRLVLADGEQAGIVPLAEALEHAEKAELDLVEVAPDGAPPVCKIVDYSKILYDQKRKARDARKKQRLLDLKEIKLRPSIGEHDLDFKVNHAEKFLVEGHKVKMSMFFRGREITHQEIGRAVFDTVIEALKDVSEVDRNSVRYGKNFSMILTPKVHK